MTITSVNLLHTVTNGYPYYGYDGSSSTLVGIPVKAAGYYGRTSGLQTIGISTENFEGIIQIQATLVHNPKESEWITVYEFGDISTSITNNEVTNIYGNYVWFRAVVDYFTYGTIHEIVMSY